MRKIAIIGAGISGLSIAQILKNNHDVSVFETEVRPGGMIKCDIVDGNLFHRTGGHVFNTKRQDVKEWFWSFFDKDNEFINTVRNSAVHYVNKRDEETFIPYPIENHSYYFDETIQKEIIRDWLDIAGTQQNSDNFEDFLRKRFGNTLYDIYFRPYNEKVWRNSLKNVPLDWLEGKLPMPSVEEMIFNNMNHIEEKNFVHSTFFYPIKGGSQFLANRLSEGLNIIYGKKIERTYKENDKWIIDGNAYDSVIFCGNIKQLPSLLGDRISPYVSYIDDLKSHGTTAVFCEIDKNPYSWLYLPSQQHHSHRIICTGNFSPSNNSDNKMTATIEFTDFISKEEIISELSFIPFNPHYLTHHYEKYTYPIQQKDTREMISSINSDLMKDDFYLLGRFALWEYANMDVCMGMALDLAKKI